ncbi:MAG: hypothetical protein ACLQUZ_11910 [Rhizomicrobium sp.]
MAADLQRAFIRVYSGETDWESRIRSVKLVADALNKGEMARAMMTAVLMRLPDPGDAIGIADVDVIRGLQATHGHCAKHCRIVRFLPLDV